MTHQQQTDAPEDSLSLCNACNQQNHNSDHGNQHSSVHPRRESQMALSLGTKICAQEASQASDLLAESVIIVKNSIQSFECLQYEDKRKKPQIFSTSGNFLGPGTSLPAAPFDILSEIENNDLQNTSNSCPDKREVTSNVSASMDFCFLKESSMLNNTGTCTHHNWQNDPCESLASPSFLPNTYNSRPMNMELGDPVLNFSTSSGALKSINCEESQLEKLLLFQMGDELSTALVSGHRDGLGNFDSELQNDMKQNSFLNHVHLISGHGYTEALVQEFNSASNLGDIILDNNSGFPFFSELKEDLLEAVVAGFPSSRKLEPRSCSVTIDDISSQSGSSKGANFIDETNKRGYPLGDSTQVSSSIQLQKPTNTNTKIESTSFFQDLLKDNSGMHSEREWVNRYKHEDTPNTARRTCKQGKTGRPRPKDRQQIQDRVRELRDIIPNANKCSIDALLERTIKYIKFLHTVTQNAGRWSYKGIFKMSGDEARKGSLKESESGACWAVDLAAYGEIQRRHCPIIVENLSQPGQMLVEILCEDKGIFLEIANNIRGLGLTILKGVMEVRNGHIWCRFVVEAVRDIHRMEVLWSLAHFIELVSSDGKNATISI
ncbi:hypothetical protein SUGI_0865150 [Cryptomeria japonica]|uniref:uncharacterized protein LOC131029841 n=1 Tax=Cryptomeria japonica TaxID=3369 RepID=UPI00241482FB|nr:uncharacterized protein LOC131029841 [Cryptomeria japonica]XP_057816475.1 uncharacterized protein LOC131029841 [Cryptomeria japonica]XP_057816477.1 uncharacterized protein LOC131029841 [Cryptomeria japonica]GLJ41802.1 hypothetical protein SUGI_0865150 [Cryptomeria japonica]